MDDEYYCLFARAQPPQRLILRTCLYHPRRLSLNEQMNELLLTSSNSNFLKTLHFICLLLLFLLKYHQRRTWYWFIKWQPKTTIEGNWNWPEYSVFNPIHLNSKGTKYANWKFFPNAIQKVPLNDDMTTDRMLMGRCGITAHWIDPGGEYYIYFIPGSRGRAERDNELLCERSCLEATNNYLFSKDARKDTIEGWRRYSI